MVLPRHDLAFSGILAESYGSWCNISFVFQASNTVDSAVDDQQAPVRQISNSVVFAHRNALFGRRKGEITRKEKKGEGWTAQFVSMSDKDSLKTPTVEEKEILRKAGLGLKKIRLSNNDYESDVFEKLKTEFSKLENAGFFELLRTYQNRRTLYILDGPWSSTELKSKVGPQAKIYVLDPYPYILRITLKNK